MRKFCGTMTRTTTAAHFPPIIPADALDYAAATQTALANVQKALRIADEMFIRADDLRALEAELVPVVSRARLLATAASAAAFWQGGDPSVPVSREALSHAHA